jgi:hypothetical protein
MIERFRAYGVLRPSVERSLRIATSVEDTMRLIETLLSRAGSSARAAESRGV